MSWIVRSTISQPSQVDPNVQRHFLVPGSVTGEEAVEMVRRFETEGKVSLIGRCELSGV